MRSDPHKHVNPVHIHTHVLQVDLLFKQHAGMLKALYSRYRLKPSGGGLRPKVLKLDYQHCSAQRGLLTAPGNASGLLCPWCVFGRRMLA